MTTHVPPSPPRRTFRAAVVAVTGLVTLLATACSTVGDTGAGAGAGDDTSGTVTLVTHDSFSVDKRLLRDFEADSGLSVETVAPGDAGTVVNQLVLSQDSPLGDAVFGIDTSFASRALSSGIMQPYESPEETEAAQRFDVDGSDRLTPVDYGDVCINIDREWFAERDVPEPRTLEDLTEPEYEDLTVVSNPATSSPGLSFLLATVDAFGEDDWQDYWAALRDNGLKVAQGWSDAYFVDFSGSSGRGPRPIVLSYASSPPAEVRPGSDEAPTRALLGTCFRQVEYAGVLDGAANPEGAQLLVDFLLSTRVQESIPTSMYVYPVDPRAELPDTWRRFAPLAEDPYTVGAEAIDDNREEWIQQWSEVVVG